jgi:hypothetical protein
MKRKLVFATGAVVAGLIGGCASQSGAYNPPPRLDDDTRVVSCKLPPQVRRLGQHATYLAAGRIVRTVAADCRVRGGQITELASAPATAVAPDGSMPVIVGGDGTQSACPVAGTIGGLKSASTLNVRTGPGTEHARLDALRNGQRVFVCDGTADEQWLGVVYPASGTQDCGVGAPLAEGRAYAGPCRVGWVNAGWVIRDPASN